MSLDERDYMRRRPPHFGEWLKGWTAFHVIFAVNVAVFFLQWGLHEAWVRDVLTGELIRPWGGISVEALTLGRFWTPLTFMFVHDGWWSFLGTMLLFWTAGRRVQVLFGSRSLVIIYLLAGVVGAAVQMAIFAYLLKSTSVILMGATASSLGVLLAYAVAMPEEEVPVFSVSLWTFLRFVLGGYALVGGLSLFGVLPSWVPRGAGDCFAHLGGGLAGWYFARSLGYGGVPAHLLHSSGSSLRRQPQMVSARRPRLPVVDVDLEAVRKENPRNDPLLNLMKDEIDPILDKINDHGMGSLTNDERRTLERASRRFVK